MFPLLSSSLSPLIPRLHAIEIDCPSANAKGGHGGSRLGSVSAGLVQQQQQQRDRRSWGIRKQISNSHSPTHKHISKHIQMPVIHKLEGSARVGLVHHSCSRPAWLAEKCVTGCVTTDSTRLDRAQSAAQPAPRHSHTHRAEAQARSASIELRRTSKLFRPTHSHTPLRRPNKKGSAASRRCDRAERSGTVALPLAPRQLPHTLSQPSPLTQHRQHRHAQPHVRAGRDRHRGGGTL